MYSYSRRIWMLKYYYSWNMLCASLASIIILRNQHSGHAECNRLYNGAVLVIIWFFHCILIMNRLQYRKNNMLSVCASSAGAIAILVYRSKTFKTVKLLQSKKNYFLAVVFLSVNFGSCHNKRNSALFFSFVLLICQWFKWNIFRA